MGGIACIVKQFLDEEELFDENVSHPLWPPFQNGWDDHVRDWSIIMDA